MPYLDFDYEGYLSTSPEIPLETGASPPQHDPKMVKTLERLYPLNGASGVEPPQTLDQFMYSRVQERSTGLGDRDRDQVIYKHHRKCSYSAIPADETTTPIANQEAEARPEQNNRFQARSPLLMVRQLWIMKPDGRKTRPRLSNSTFTT